MIDERQRGEEQELEESTRAQKHITLEVAVFSRVVVSLTLEFQGEDRQE